jgi:hypothetical protein
MRFLIYMQRIDKEGLMKLLEEWNVVLSKEKFNIRLIAIGGTALTLLNLKASTKDIDFTLPLGEDIKKFESLFNRLKIKQVAMRRFKAENFLIDIYYDGQIFTTTFPDDLVKECTIIHDFRNIQLYVLSLYDIIISKIARSSVDDEQDIKTIFEKENINLNKLKKRYRQIQELTSDKNMEYHFKRLLEVLLPIWKSNK